MYIENYETNLNKPLSLKVGEEVSTVSLNREQKIKLTQNYIAVLKLIIRNEESKSEKPNADLLRKYKEQLERLEKILNSI